MDRQMTPGLPDPYRSRAVLVGTSRFTSPTLEDLPAVRRNLDGLATSFQDPDLWGLPRKNCAVIADPETADGLLDPVHEAATEAEDTLLFYYAGHGLVHPRTQLLLLSLVGSTAARPHSAVQYEFVRDYLIEARAARRIVILDCCYSGRALGGGMSDPTVAVANEASAEGTYVMTSAPSNRVALSPPGETYTAFTGALLTLLNTGVPDGPAVLALDDIFRHVRDDLWRRSRPLPERRSLNTAGHLALVRNRYRAPAPPAVPPPGEPLVRAVAPPVVRPLDNDVRSAIRDPVPAQARPRPAAAPADATREAIKAMVREQGMENLYSCPVCRASVRGRNLVRHYDQHPESAAAMIRRIEKTRDLLKNMVRQKGQAETYACPVCGVNVAGKNLIRHYDKHPAAERARN